MDIVEALRKAHRTKDGKSYRYLQGTSKKTKQANEFSATEKAMALIAFIYLVFYFTFKWVFET